VNVSYSQTHRTINTRFDTDLKNLKNSQFSWKSCDKGLRKNSTERGEEKRCRNGHFRGLKCKRAIKTKAQDSSETPSHCISFSQSSSLVSFWPVINDALKKTSCIWRFSSLRHWIAQGFFLTSLHERSREFFLKPSWSKILRFSEACQI
jgi:hypothetical protein